MISHISSGRRVTAGYKVNEIVCAAHVLEEPLATDATEVIIGNHNDANNNL